MNANLELLQAVLENLDEPSADADILIDMMLKGSDGREPAAAYTASLDAAVELVRQQLPGWLWRVMSCSVSDDAWVTPDFNDPVHGERLRTEWPQECQVDPLAYLKTDLDRRPSGQPAIALLQSMLVGLQAEAVRKFSPG